MPPAWLSSPALAVAPLIALLALLAGGLLAFAAQAARGKVARTERVERQGGTVLLGKWAMEFGLWMLRPVQRTAVRLGIHPDAISWASLVLHLVAGLLLAAGAFGPAGWVLALGAACDSLDGAVARARGIASDAGELLDAAVDRWGEAAVFLGCAYYYRGLWWGFLLAGAALAGAFMVSYARAKGEAAGVDARMGLMQRHERAALLVVATAGSALWEAARPAQGFALHAPVLVALGLIAILANRTAWQRTALARRQLRGR